VVFTANHLTVTGINWWTQLCSSRSTTSRRNML